jgi:hypothetical protein
MGTKEKTTPLFTSLGINGFPLSNCMLDFGASTNVMPLKVMKQLGLQTNRPYGNVCGIDSKRDEDYSLIEDLKVYNLHVFPHIDISMNVVVIDVLDAWGMLFSRSWSTTLGVFINMDLTHAHIPMGEWTFDILYSQAVAKNHVTDPNSPDY